MKERLPTLLIFMLTQFHLFCQEPERSYTQYGTEDGLAGSTVYCVAQDKDGFLWFGTETGASRFDGTHFKNYSTLEGLPDNEILELFVDSKGRVWMAPFKKAVCYYYKGKIHNSENDSLIKQVKPRENILKFAEDANGNILIMEAFQMHLLGQGKVKLINSINDKPIANFVAVSKSASGNFLVLTNDGLFELRQDKFHFIVSPKRIERINHLYAIMSEQFSAVTSSPTSIAITDILRGTSFIVPRSMLQLKTNFIGDSLFVSNNQTGAIVYPLKGDHTPRRYMVNKPVSQTFIDREGNYWFTTLGEGVFRLNSESMATVRLRNQLERNLPAYSIKITPDHWVIGSDILNIFTIARGPSSSVRVTRIWDEYGSLISGRVTAIETTGNGKYLVGADIILEVIPSPRTAQRYTTSVKGIFKENEDVFLVATRQQVIRIHIPDFKILDTIWNERSTAVYEKNDTIYVGTLDGLYVVYNDSSNYFAGDREPLLRNRVTAVASSPEGLIWIATTGAGLIGYRHGKIERRISVDNNLSSNNCRAIAVNGNELWVGTDKGLDRVQFQSDSTFISSFTVSDGLSSNIINTVAIDKNTVIVGTPGGINYFDAGATSFKSFTNLLMDDILVADRHLDPDSRSFSLPHNDNNIRFQFSGITFRSNGEVFYKYRLVGLDTSWKYTKENFLDYPTLPSGEYRLEVRAFNKFGVQSNLLTIPFAVEGLLVEKIWFRALVLAVLLVATFLFVYWLIRRVRRRDMEKNDIRRRISELEQLALKSQMNPHFIFNCLNSIQQFVLDKDVEGSNRFITGFSRLIRQTLDISAKREIPLSEEIIYLSTYLELEKTRFENKFTYEIRVANGLNVEQVYIPPMMLQPFVENSIRHGIRYRSDLSGRILVSFDRTETALNCVVEDNGVGREVARSFKSNNPIEYQSKGMSLIADRVEFLNLHSTNPITIKIEDLTDENANPAGTRIIMKFPLEHGD